MNLGCSLIKRHLAGVKLQTCCSQPEGLLAPRRPASPRTPGSSLNSADKRMGNNNAAQEWLTANSENTQQLGFGRVCVYLGVHWQWHVEPGGPSPLPIRYEPLLSNTAFVTRHPAAIHTRPLLQFNDYYTKSAGGCQNEMSIHEISIKNKGHLSRRGCLKNCRSKQDSDWK